MVSKYFNNEVYKNIWHIRIYEHPVKDYQILLNGINQNQNTEFAGQEETVI